MVKGKILTLRCLYIFNDEGVSLPPSLPVAPGEVSQGR
jgi:hypothetical protein